MWSVVLDLLIHDTICVLELAPGFGGGVAAVVVASAEGPD